MRQREHDADAHDGAGHALAAVADAELVGGEVDRLGEQRVDEAARQRAAASRPRTSDLAVRRAGRAAPTTAAAGSVAGGGRWRRVRRTSGANSPTEPRHAEPVVDRPRRPPAVRG